LPLKIIALKATSADPESDIKGAGGRFRTGLDLLRRTAVSSMIPTPPEPKYTPGTRLRVTQYVRVGHRRWLTQVEGQVQGEGMRPVGGIEMGGKASYCQQPVLRLRLDDGEISEIALDEETKIEAVPVARE
jgi:hypothetical protein